MIRSHDQGRILIINYFPFQALDPELEPFIPLHLHGHSLAAHGNGGATHVAEVLPQFLSAQAGEFPADRWSRLLRDCSSSPLSPHDEYCLTTEHFRIKMVIKISLEVTYERYPTGYARNKGQAWVS